MIDYKNGKIYRLVCYETGEIYIGSTAVSLEDRLTKHKTPSNRCYSKQIIDRGNYYIELLENYPCNSEYELNLKEGEYHRAIECINHNIAGRTKSEYMAQWRQDNKEKLAKYYKEYQQDNKEVIATQKIEYYQDNKEAILASNSKVVICECGIKSTRINLPRHKRTKKHIDLMANI
tara:strand:- start:54 stop:581 length:528 start_codon:yes stop_codon:yes gene_type:complete